MDYEFFISYRRADTQAAQKIWRALRDRGHRVFFDTDSLDAGDFTENIRAAIESCEIVVAILTERSLERMFRDPETDMVRKELEFCREARQLVQFFMLLNDPAARKGQLYDILKRYESDELMRWIARQNITEFQGEDEPADGVMGIAGVCGKILQAKADKVRALHFEEQLGKERKRLTYYGRTRREERDGSRYPFGKGRLVEDGKPEGYLVYDGEWEGGSRLANRLSGFGDVYIRNRDGRRMIYHGHWSELLYDDLDGVLYDDDGVSVRYRGPFLKGEMLGARKARYTGGGRVYQFEGRYDSLYHVNPVYGELRVAHGGMEDVFFGNVQETAYPFHTVRPTFGRMEYANGTVYEGEFGVCKEKSVWEGWGAAEIPAPGFLLRVECAFDDGRPAKSDEPASVSVRLEGETEFRQLVYGSAFPYARAADGAFRYLDGTVYKGSWDGEKGWAYEESSGFRRIHKPKGAFFDAQGREFTPTKEQLDFYDAQGKALIRPLLEWSDDKTAEELTRGEPLPLVCPEAAPEEPAADGIWNEPELQNEFTTILNMARSMGVPEGVTAKDVVDAILAKPALAGQWQGLGSTAEREVFLLSKAPDIVIALLTR